MGLGRATVYREMARAASGGSRERRDRASPPGVGARVPRRRRRDGCPDARARLVGIAARPPRYLAADFAHGGRALLNSAVPDVRRLGAGADYLYNDAYTAVLGAKHPRALGLAVPRDLAGDLADIWPLVEAAMRRGGDLNERLPLVMERHGYAEDTWFTCSYRPMPDESGQIAGMFCACTETTPRCWPRPARAAERDRLADVQQSPSFLAVLRGPEHVFEFVNAEYRRLFSGRRADRPAGARGVPEVEGQGIPRGAGPGVRDRRAASWTDIR